MAEQENIQPESMEDILSSIRETVEEEAAAATDGSPVEAVQDTPANDTDIDALMDNNQPEQPPAQPEDDIDALDLSDMLEEDDVAEPAPQETSPQEEKTTEEVIDIAAFSSTGEEVIAEEEKAENARELYRGGEVNEELMTETNTEEPAIEEPAEQPIEEPAIEEEIETQAETPQETATKQPETEEKEPVIEEQIEAVTSVATETLAQAVATETVHLPTSPSADGLQVTFPVEVLAAALRPLVKDWVADNLPNVVERLVKEELSKLANQ